MKRIFFSYAIIILLVPFTAYSVYGQDELEIWQEFVTALKKGEITSDNIHPYYENLREPILEFLRQIREEAQWAEFEAIPEIHRVGDQVHYLIALTLDGQKCTYCFTILVKENKWYFQHLESITLRLDKITSLPTSTFPDIPEGEKFHIREEIRASEHVRLFNFLAKEKGKEFAFNWFSDGAGYYLAAKVWVPFLPASKAFILYACWEQSNLRGNKVTLEKLNDNEASFRLRSTYLELYKITGHLKQQISFEDYRQIFNTIWLDRANNAGWDLEITYEQGECILHFNKKQ
jgi:hypothetical protein